MFGSCCGVGIGGIINAGGEVGIRCVVGWALALNEASPSKSEFWKEARKAIV